MKKSALKTMRNLSLLLTSSFLLATQALGQVALKPVAGAGSYGTPTITTSVGDACLDYTSGVGNNHVYNFGGVSGLGTPTYSWSIVGGASIVGSANGSSVTVKPVVDGKGRYNKARLAIFYKGTIDSNIVVTSCPVCNGVTPPPQTVPIKIPKSGTVYVDLYQKFDYPDQIVGNVCVSAGDSAAYSIRDLVSGNATLGIGLDSYYWVPNAAFNGIVTPINSSQYVAGDSSSITYKFGTTPVPGTVYTINVTAGKCNVGGAGKLKTKTLAQKLPAPATTPAPSSTTCLNASQTTFTITNSTLLSGVTYKWSKSNDNWTYTSGSTPTTQNVTYNTLSQSGNVYLTSTASSGSYCGTRVDTFRVKRSLTGTAVTSSTGATCFTRGQAYTFQINPSPSTGVVWTVPSGWTVDPNNLNSPIVTITAGAAAVSGTISAVGQDCSGTATALTVNIAPIQPTPITGPACVTRGSSYTFSVPTVYGATSYNWTFPTGWTFTPAGANSVTATVGAAGVTGTVSVNASGGAGCSNTAATSITSSVIAPKPGTITRTPSTCINKGLTDTLTFSVTAVPGVTYQWILPSGWVAAASNTAPYNTYIVYSNGQAGSTYIKVRGQSTCSGTTYYSAYDSLLVTTNGIGTTVTITKTPLDADSDGIQDGENLTANAIASPVKYQWYNASGEITGETSRFLDLLNPGTPSATYFVRVAKNGCQTQVGTNSDYSYARVANTGASAADLMAKVKVYPVPATDVVAIDLPVSYDEATVDFIDMTGASVLSKNLHGKASVVNITKLDAGSYYMLFNVDGTTFSKKIIVTK